MSEVKETKLWTSGLLKSVNVSSLSDLSPQSLKLIDGCQKKIVKELEHVKGKTATEVVDLQRKVVTLQRDLLAEKDRQLTELRTSVVESV